MRDIKFRAWDKKKNKMYQSEKLLISFGWLGLPFFNLDFASGENIHSGIFFSEKSEFALMQYTGLKDKNGKEIYEGDIFTVGNVITGAKGLRPGFSFNEDDDIYKVCWDKEMYCWTFDFNEDLNDICSNTWVNTIRNFLINGEVEILGNVYENPELLK